MIVMGALFLVIFALGYWLGRTEKPYSVLLLTAHKLIALGVFVFLIVTAVQSGKAVPFTALEWAVLILSAVFFVAAIVTGGLVSVEKTMPVFLSVLHKVLPYLAVLSTAASLYLLWRK
jgi:hypothetical protein